MEKSSRLGMADNRHQYPADEDKELTKAALFLSYLKHVGYDSKTARDLENTKHKFLGSSGLYPNSVTKRKAVQIQGLEAPQAQKAINAAEEDQGLPGQPQFQVQDEDRGMIKAALSLCCLKHVVLDSKTAANLESTKCKFLSRSGLYPNAGTKGKAQPEGPQAQKAINAAAQGQGLPGQTQLQGLFYGDYVPPEIPPVPTLQNVIEVCSKPFEKQLTCSDVREDQSRLSMKKDDVQKHILPLLNDDENLNQGIHVTVYDIAGKGHPMIFKTWASKIYVLTSGWRSFYESHGLVKIKDFVTLWVFRNAETRRLCFVVHSRRLPVSGIVKRLKTRHD